jgi:hypothetical protein
VREYRWSERRPLWLGGLEREYWCSELWAAEASGGRSRERVSEGGVSADRCG